MRSFLRETWTCGNVELVQRDSCRPRPVVQSAKHGRNRLGSGTTAGTARLRRHADYTSGNTRTFPVTPRHGADVIMIIGVVKESWPGERRVALAPGVVAPLVKAGLVVL